MRRKSALRDTTYVARAAIIEAFSKYGITVSRSLLDAALADKDWAVRVRAAALLRQSDPATDAGMVIATQKILHDPRHPSYLELSVVPGLKIPQP